MPQTFRMRVLLALSAMNKAADLVGTRSTAVGTNHLATSNLLDLDALEEGWSLSSERKQVIDLQQLLIGASQ